MGNRIFRLPICLQTRQQEVTNSLPSYQEIAHQLKDLTLASTLLRLFLAAVCGGMVGMERGRRRRAAGLRTHMLVCIGATLVMITNQYIFLEYGTSDPARLGAQVISGIGFLGVGTIIVDRQHQVRGLTTAAGLWTCACMGLAIGIGFYIGALIACVFILGTIIILNRFERHIIGKSRIMEVYAEFGDHQDVTHFINKVVNSAIKVDHLEMVQPRGHQGTDDKRVAAVMTLQLPKRHLHTKVLEELDAVSNLLLIEEMH